MANKKQTAIDKLIAALLIRRTALETERDQILVSYGAKMEEVATLIAELEQQQAAKHDRKPRRVKLARVEGQPA